MQYAIQNSMTSRSEEEKRHDGYLRILGKYFLVASYPGACLFVLDVQFACSSKGKKQTWEVYTTIS